MRTRLRRARAFLVLPLLLAASGLAGCKDGLESTNPLPKLFSADPDTLTVGSGTQTITLFGEGFSDASIARWNGGDRPTTFVGATSLRMTVSAADVSATGDAEIVVYTPPPGGGTSGVLAISTTNPAPRITSVTPDSVDRTAGGFVLTVTGEGFVPGAHILWSGNHLYTVLQDDGRLTTEINEYQLGSAGVFQISVANPPPGGGVSAARSLTVLNPVPALTEITPDSALTDDQTFTLTATGSAFVPESRILWNGAAIPTTYAASDRLTAEVDAQRVATAGTIAVSVETAGPGGGTTEPREFRALPAPPRIQSLAPGHVVSGADDFILTVEGRNFDASSRVRLNGSDRPTVFVNGRTLRASIYASDVSSVGTAGISVSNADGTESSIIGLPVVDDQAVIASETTVDLTTNDIVYDPDRNVIYASVPSSVSGHGNSIAAIDPATGAVFSSLHVGSEPGRLAISDDARYLYVVLDGAAALARVDLAAGAKDFEMSLGDAWLGALHAARIAVVPGRPRSVVVSLRNMCCSPSHEGVAIFDDDVARPARTQGHTGSNSIAFTSDGRLYGYNNETTEFGFREISISSSGLSEAWVSSGLVDGFSLEIVGDEHLIFATNGTVVDPARRERVGTLGAEGLVRPDLANGRVHVLSGSTLSTFSASSLGKIGELQIPGSGEAGSLIRWGSRGLAVRRADSILILESSIVGS